MRGSNLLPTTVVVRLAIANLNRAMSLRRAPAASLDQALRESLALEWARAVLPMVAHIGLKTFGRGSETLTRPRG